MSKEKSDGETVIWNYDALLLARKNAGVSLDAKCSIDLSRALFKVSLSDCCESIAVSPPVCRPPSLLPWPTSSPAAGPMKNA